MYGRGRKALRSQPVDQAAQACGFLRWHLLPRPPHCWDPRTGLQPRRPRGPEAKAAKSREANGAPDGHSRGGGPTRLPGLSQSWSRATGVEALCSAPTGSCHPLARCSGERKGTLTCWPLILLGPFSWDDGCFFKDEDGSPSLPGRLSLLPKFTRAKGIRNKIATTERINMPGEKWIINSSPALHPNNKWPSIRESWLLN